MLKTGKKLEKEKIVLDKDEDNEDVQLGQGSTGTVYKGKYYNYHVAVKKIDFCGSTAATEKELKMYCRLTHPKIIRLFGYYTTKTKLCLVLELGNQNLRVLLESHSGNRLLFSKALTLALHISEGVRYLHGCDIIHLDIKSSNVIVFDNNLAKITDFGSARKMITTTTQSTLGKAGRGRYS